MTTAKISVVKLPTGVTDTGQQLPSGSGTNAAYRAFQLPGLANSDTIPPGGVTEANATTVHPAFYLQILAFSAADPIDQPSADERLGILQKTVDINGSPALFTYPAQYGFMSLDWVHAGTRFRMFLMRAHTPEGISGFDEETFLNVARGVGLT